MFRTFVGEKVPLPYFENAPIQAGFPSPADDFATKTLDLNDLLIVHPLATIYMRASGQSMVPAGIHDRDILIVDRAVKPVHGQIVVAQLENEFTVKYFHNRGGQVKLISADPDYPEITPQEGQTLLIVGVVTGAVTVFTPCAGLK